jgi:hypothetical protein
MAARSTVDSRKFMDAMTGIQRNLRVPLKTVIRTEAGSILKQCAGDTKVATQAQADIRSRTRVTRDLGYSGRGRSKGDHPVTINSGMKGEVGKVFILKKDGTGFRRTHSKNFDALHQHYKTSQWRDLQDAIADVKAGWNRAIPLGRQAVGLARQSWIQIADRVGIMLETVPGGGISTAGIAKARQAIASNGRAYQNGQAAEFQNNQSYLIQLTNSLPYGRRAKLDRILVRRMNGRVAFFAKNVKLGVFNSVSKILAAYPGFKVAV